MFTKSRIVGILLLTALVTGSVFASAMADFSASGKNGNSRDLKVLNYADFTQANTVVDHAWTWGTFRDRNPSISVSVEDLFNEPFHNKTEAYIASGNMPDVLYVWPSGRSTSLHEQKLLKDLTPLINRDGLNRVYPSGVLDPSQMSSGYISMIPLTVTNTHTLFINMEVLNDCGLQPARTYTELLTQVPILRAKGYDTIVMAAQDDWGLQSCLFSMIAGRFCGAGWEARINNGTARFTDADFIAALAFIQSMVVSGVMRDNVIGIGYGDGPGMFANNRCAYYIDGDWRVGAFLTDSSTGQALIPPARQRNIRLGVFPDIPAAKINKSSSTVLGTGWAISADVPAGSAREDAAWTLVKWLTSQEVQTRGVQSGAYTAAARNDVDASRMNLEPLQITAASLGSSYDTSTCVIDGAFHSDVYSHINVGLQQLVMNSTNLTLAREIAQRTQNAFDQGRRAGQW